LQWTLTNTSSLNTASPNLQFDVTPIGVEQYAVPPRATQPAGNRPLGTCIADTIIFPTCNSVIAGRAPSNHNNATFGSPNGSLNSNDSCMQEVMYANEQLWDALDTAVSVGGQAGIAHTDLTYPAIGVTDSGRGVTAFTLTGDNNYPSAAFAGLDAKFSRGNVQIAAAGVGPWDGFTSYITFGAGRPRWGDYGYAAVIGQDIWIASEYVAQTCTYATYIVDPTCGGTRAPLGNWALVRCSS
jgi:hypothetical protein